MRHWVGRAINSDDTAKKIRNRIAPKTPGKQLIQEMTAKLQAAAVHG